MRFSFHCISSLSSERNRLDGETQSAEDAERDTKTIALKPCKLANICVSYRCRIVNAYRGDTRAAFRPYKVGSIRCDPY